MNKTAEAVTTRKIVAETQATKIAEGVKAESSKRRKISRNIKNRTAPKESRMVRAVDDKPYYFPLFITRTIFYISRIRRKYYNIYYTEDK